MGIEVMRRGYTKSTKNVSAFKVLDGELIIGFVNPELVEFEELISIVADENDHSSHFLFTSWLNMKSVFELRSGKNSDLSVLQFSRAALNELIREGLANKDQSFPKKMVRTQLRILEKLLVAITNRYCEKLPPSLDLNMDLRSRILRSIVYDFLRGCEGIFKEANLSDSKFRVVMDQIYAGASVDEAIANLIKMLRSIMVARTNNLSMQLDIVEQMINVVYLMCGAKPY
jgi:hypothetical protein